MKLYNITHRVYICDVLVALVDWSPMSYAIFVLADEGLMQRKSFSEEDDENVVKSFIEEEMFPRCNVRINKTFHCI